MDDYEKLTIYYVGNMIYENGTLKRILTPEGYWQNGTYYYFLKDHLGSNRVVITGSGTVVESSSFYPSGIRFGESAAKLNNSVQPYRHTGLEMQEMHGLNWIDNNVRFRTVSNGSGFTGVDPFCEKYYSISPYAYCAGNPMRYIDPTGMLVDDYFNEHGAYLGKDEASTDNVKIISQNSWDNLKTANNDGTETIDHATGAQKSVNNSESVLSTSAELSVYNHYNSTGQTLNATSHENGNGGAAFWAKRNNGVITTGIEVNIEGNKSLKIADHANEIRNVFSHEGQHKDDFEQFGYTGYGSLPDSFKESRAVQTQMNQSTFSGMRPEIQQSVKNYGSRFGMIYPIATPIQGIKTQPIIISTPKIYQP